MEDRTISLRCADGIRLTGTLYGSEKAGRGLLVAGALGVPRRFYATFAQYMAAAGWLVLTLDYRGSGDSLQGLPPGRQLRMQKWGEQDIEAGLRCLRDERSVKTLALLGHSAGAQLPGLAPASRWLDALVLVAGTAPHLRHYPWRSRPMLALVWYGLAPLLSWRRDHFPTRATGLGTTPVAAGVVAQWARWARSRNYLFDTRHGIDTRGYGRLRLPLLSCGFADDSYASQAAIEALLRHYSAAAIERRWVPAPAHEPIGHFGYFRQRQAGTLWQDTRDWLDIATQNIPGENNQCNT